MKRIPLNRDLNSNIIWDGMEAQGTENCLGNKLLGQYFFLYQHIASSVRKRTDEPSLLDFVFTKQKDDTEGLIYNSPFGEKNHVLP